MRGAKLNEAKLNEANLDEARAGSWSHACAAIAMPGRIFAIRC